MLTERLISTGVRVLGSRCLDLSASKTDVLPDPKPGEHYMLYAHVPFCERLCPYCSFNRFPFSEGKAHKYFANLRKEMMMLRDMGYDFESMYVGGGTPTILIDELVDTINLAKENFSISDVSSETNPNHLIEEYIEKLDGVVDRLSVGVQSFDNGLLKQMDRYDKYGSAEQILERVRNVADAKVFKSLNVDMMYNFPAQTEEMLRARPRHDSSSRTATRPRSTRSWPRLRSSARSSARWARSTTSASSASTTSSSRSSSKAMTRCLR